MKKALINCKEIPEELKSSLKIGLVGVLVSKKQVNAQNMSVLYLCLSKMTN